MNILERILAAKKIEVESRKASNPVQALEKKNFFDRKCISLVNSLKDPGSSGVIAEFKRKSPSKGEFSADAKSSVICPGYQKAGAAGLSILSDYEFFGGTSKDIEDVRPLVSIPILRKDFIIDPYQIVEAKAIGADVILLIAAALSVKRCKELAHFAKSLGLEVLLEVHSKEELINYSSDNIDLLGVNNRDLKTFSICIELSKELAALIPTKFTKVSESGLENPKDALELKTFGYRGFLIGETFMKQIEPTQECARFIEGLRCA